MSLEERIKEQGERVRKMKADKADKDQVRNQSMVMVMEELVLHVAKAHVTGSTNMLGRVGS